jgi:CDP-glycerol glycerophosphotransferase (TagB/SpsB family)
LAAIRSIFIYITYYLCFLIPRNKKLWLYSSLNGRFLDNSKYLFLYAHQHSKNIRHVWISSSQETVENLLNKGFEAYHLDSRKAKLLSLRAGAFIYSSYITSICNAAFTGGAFRFNLWHGIPLKKIENDISKGPLRYLYNPANFSEWWKRLSTSPALIRKNDAVLTTSNHLIKIFTGAFRIPRHKIFVGQYPRLMPFGWNREQLLMHIKKIENADMLSMINNFTNFDEVIIYMPTWRDDDPCFINKAIPEFSLLDRACGEHNILFVLKLHVNTVFKEDISGYKNLLLLDNNLDVYPLLPFTTSLLTDYSSIFFDYALLNKKIIFYPFDIENYKSKNRELYFDYEELTKDEIIAYSFTGLLEIISQRKQRRYTTPSFKKYLNESFQYDREIDFIKHKVGL